MNWLRSPAPFDGGSNQFWILDGEKALAHTAPRLQLMGMGAAPKIYRGHFPPAQQDSVNPARQSCGWEITLSGESFCQLGEHRPTQLQGTGTPVREFYLKLV